MKMEMKLLIFKHLHTGEIPTNVKFPEPIFLAPGREYAIVVYF
jgi:hypothetical protein